MSTTHEKMVDTILAYDKSVEKPIEIGAYVNGLTIALLEKGYVLPDPYPVEDLGGEDNGTMVQNVETVREAVVGHKIVSAERRTIDTDYRYGRYGEGFVITLDNGKEVILEGTSDCCAHTYLESFLLDPAGVDHIITGVGTTNGYQTWHIYADLGDVLKLQVDWSSGNPFYYGYGFDITVRDIVEADLVEPPLEVQALIASDAELRDGWNSLMRKIKNARVKY